MVNIKNYAQLDADMLDYFENQFFDIADKSLSTSIFQNETRDGGRSYQLCRSTIEYLKPQETLQEVEQSFRQPIKCQGAFGYESDEGSDDECAVRIRREKPPAEDECHGVEQNLLMAFNAFLRLPGEAKLTAADIRNRLEDPNVLCSLDDVGQMSKGTRQFVQQMAFFESTIVPDAPEVPEMISRESSIVSSTQGSRSSEKENSLLVPDDSTNRSRKRTSEPSRPIMTRSRADRAEARANRNANNAQVLTPSQDNTSARLSGTVIKPPAINPRMNAYMKEFRKHPKRRRDSRSPE